MWGTEILIARVPLYLQGGERQEFCKSKHSRVGLQSGVIIICNIYIYVEWDTIYTARSEAYNEKFCIKM